MRQQALIRYLRDRWIFIILPILVVVIFILLAQNRYLKQQLRAVEKDTNSTEQIVTTTQEHLFCFAKLVEQQRIDLIDPICFEGSEQIVAPLRRRINAQLQIEQKENVKIKP